MAYRLPAQRPPSSPASAVSPTHALSPRHSVLLAVPWVFHSFPLSSMPLNGQFVLFFCLRHPSYPSSLEESNSSSRFSLDLTPLRKFLTSPMGSQVFPASLMALWHWPMKSPRSSQGSLGKQTNPNAKPSPLQLIAGGHIKGPASWKTVITVPHT